MLSQFWLPLVVKFLICLVTVAGVEERSNSALAVLLKDFKLALGKKSPAPDGVRVRAKTGTLNFVSSLAGFVEVRNGRKLSFAIFTADTARRDAIPPAERERPQGAKSWSRRSRQLQKELIRSWAQSFGV